MWISYIINQQNEKLALYVHHYCFGHEVGVITNYKPLKLIFKKDVASVSHRLQRILLRMHQYNIKILYKTQTTVIHQALAIK